MTSPLWPLRKHWHPRRRRLARLRAWYWIIFRRHETEICGLCGGPVQVVWVAPDWLWEKASGFDGDNGRTPGGEAAPGVLCVPCFSDCAKAAGLPFLEWTPKPWGVG